MKIHSSSYTYFIASLHKDQITFVSDVQEKIRVKKPKAEENTGYFWDGSNNCLAQWLCLLRRALSECDRPPSLCVSACWSLTSFVLLHHRPSLRPWASQAEPNPQLNRCLRGAGCPAPRCPWRTDVQGLNASASTVPEGICEYKGFSIIRYKSKGWGHASDSKLLTRDSLYPLTQLPPLGFAMKGDYLPHCMI